MCEIHVMMQAKTHHNEGPQKNLHFNGCKMCHINNKNNLLCVKKIHITCETCVLMSKTMTIRVLS